MQTTPNLGLKKYETSDTADLTAIGPNWDILDTEIVNRVKNGGGVPSIQAGLDANKPSAGTSGRIYIATDTQIIYRDTGSAWQKIGVVNWNDIANKPSVFPPATHTHTRSEITGFAHKATHAKGGADAITPADIGAVRPATIVIAASNSSTASKVAADYVCDGINDSIIINQAINSLSSVGGTVLLLEGEYNLTTAIGLNSNVTLKGVGNATVLKVASSFVDGDIIVNSDWSEGNSNIEVRDLVINGVNYTGTYALNGIHFEIGENYVIENVDLFGLKGDGIFLYGIWNSSVANCRIKTCVGSGLNLNYCDTCVFEGNIITGCDGGIYGAGIFLQISNSNCIIRNNVIYRNLRAGILLYQGTVDSLIANNLIFENSQAQNSSYGNIAIANYNSNVTIQGNLCRRGGLANQPSYGVLIENSTNNGIFVVANDLYQSGALGSINDRGTGTVVYSNRI